MATYFTSIQAAFLFFPLIALLITLPYILLQYHKYGSIPFMRTTLIYSFVLYLMVLYFLVILPLPSIEEVAHLTTPTVQMIPFHFVVDFIHETNFSVLDLATYGPTFQHPAFYTVIFNLFLFVPLGIYLRYYFKCTWKKTFCICLGTSLFLELTQLTGLYGIYPRPYRLFDVDDLLINTLGGMIGYFITPLLYLILPSRERLDEWSYERGKAVSHFRRTVAFLIDLFVIIFVTSFAFIFTPDLYLSILISFVFLYVILVPWMTQGRTLGKYIVQLKIANLDGDRAKFYQYVLRNGILYFLLLPIPFYAFSIIVHNSGQIWYIKLLGYLVCLALFVIYVNFCLQLLKSILTKSGTLMHEKLSKTKNVSTIILPKDQIEFDPGEKIEI